ncbi:hypothetical protein GH714_018933 [Hevea brasiliensis]|uniref:Uncharacterized protein n=1 Tax=Hevea brasiliensis TaxID=3981 RepID=A0A6A6LLI5_HEVBR|nr:hypothetical protein GH714_018933 [Hevea brasiliensis]
MTIIRLCGSLLKKSKPKDSFHGEGPGSELKITGSSVAEQVEDKDNKEEIDGNMASHDKYQEEDSNSNGCESQWSYDSENKGYVKLLDKYDSQIKESDCFDFDPLPGLPKVFGLTYAMKLHRDDIFSNRCKEALKYAIEK